MIFLFSFSSFLLSLYVSSHFIYNSHHNSIWVYIVKDYLQEAFIKYYFILSKIEK